MKLHRPLLSALAVFVALPVLGGANAEAAFIRRAKVKEVVDTVRGSTSYRVATTVSGDADTVRALTASVESDAGDEDVTLTETDAWLHGAASIAALPATEATLSVTLYDQKSAVLTTLTGTLGTDGTVTMAEAARDTLDLEALAGDVFPTGKAYDLTFDLAGADTYDVAYASVTVTVPGSKTCLASDEKGNCLKWGTTADVSTRAEVYWDDVGSIWEGDLTKAPEGLVEVKVTARDAKGKKLETAKAKLGAPLGDGGEGVATLATDEDPLTRVALRRKGTEIVSKGVDAAGSRFLVVSEGWSAGDALPVTAEVSVTGGDVLTVPVNSYQRKRGWQPTSADAQELFDLIDPQGARLVVTDPGTGVAVDVAEVFSVGYDSPLCGDGICATLVENGSGEAELSLTAYADDADALPDTLALSIELDGETLLDTSVSLDDEIAAVFAADLDLAGDPTGLGLTGKVKLLGEANRKGKQETLAKGNFYGTLSRDGDGDLELAGGDKDAVTSSGSLLQGAEAVALTDRDGAPQPPPAIQYGNGSGTKNATSTTSAKPELL